MNKDAYNLMVACNSFYSIRRYFIDEFFTRNISLFTHHSIILDIGGKKRNKRGMFDIEKYNLDIRYINNVIDTEPDYLCDVTRIPVDDHSVDGVIISEVLEHLLDPKAVLKEAFRLLKPGGIALICTPFIYHVHPDPDDYGRYTESWYETILSEIGYKNIKIEIEIEIEKQGLFFGVLANMLKLWVNELYKNNNLKDKFKRKFLHFFSNWFTKNSFKWDKKEFVCKSKVLNGYSTGYGIICKKP